MALTSRTGLTCYRFNIPRDMLTPWPCAGCASEAPSEPTISKKM